MKKLYLRYFGERRGGAILVIVLILLGPVFSCSEKKNNFVPAFEDESLIPSLRTDDVEMVISDSGVPRYRMEAKLWLVFDKRKEPCWFFPEGLYGERFDTLFQTELFVRSDSATFYRNKDLWQLDGNVEVMNFNDNTRLTTSQLFWDRKIRKLRIIKRHFRLDLPDSTFMEGSDGMICNEDLSGYSLYQAGPGDIIREKKKTGLTDSLTADSLRIDSLASAGDGVKRAGDKK